MKDMMLISNDDINELFSIGAGWEIYRVKKEHGIIDVKFRRKYDDGEIYFNDDGYQYSSIFINPAHLSLKQVKLLNKKGYKTPYNFQL